MTDHPWGRLNYPLTTPPFVPIIGDDSPRPENILHMTLTIFPKRGMIGEISPLTYPYFRG